MAATAAGIWSHHAATGQALSGKATPMTGPASGTSGTSSTSSTSSSSSATITANDFLTLLVTEMQNQDPTADTDPNEYINQLVQVNSLEQLIDINQNLSTALGDSTTSTTTSSDSTSASGASSAAAAKLTGKSSTGTTAQVQGLDRGKALAAAQQATSSASTSSASTVTSKANQTAAVRHAPGNLSVPEATAASHSVAEALNGQSRTH
jgi:flagellar basal-body rod modification protein FlgD